LAASQKELQKQQQVALQTTSTQKQLEHELKNERSKLNNIKNELQKEHTDRQDLKARLAEVEMELEKQKLAINQSEEIRKSQKVELAGLQKQITAQADTLATIKSKGGTLQAELTESQKGLTAQQKKALQAESVNKKLEAELNSSRKQIQELQAGLTEAQSLRKGRDGELTKLLKELEAQRQITAQAKAAKKKTASGLIAANLQKDTDDKTILNLEKANKSLEKELAATRNQIAALGIALKSTPTPEKEPAVQVAKVEPVRKPTRTAPSKVSIQAASITTRKEQKTPAPELEEKIQEPEVSAAEKPDFNGIDAFVKSWASAWGQKNVEAYLAHYSSKFQTPRKISMSAWKKQRHQRLGKPAFIKIDIQDIKQKTINDSRARVVFTQKYQSNTYRDQVVKTLDLQWENGSWAIKKETSKPL